MRDRSAVQKGFPQADKWFSMRDYIPGQLIPTLIWSKELGKVIVNPLKKWVTPYTLVTDPGIITLAAGAVSDPIPMVIDGKGHFEIFDAFFKSEQSEGFTVTLFDADSFGPDQRPILMNREIHVETIASGAGITLPISGTFSNATSGGRPYRWSENFWMDVSHAKRGAMIVAVFRNLADESNTIRFSLHGRRWYYMQADPDVAERMEEIFRERPRSMPYFWTTDEYVEKASNQTIVDFQIRLGDDAWSELHRLSLKATSPLFDILLFETASGRKFMDQTMRSDLVFGSGEFPFILSESTLLEPNMKLTARIKYPSGAVPNEIWMTFAGRKIFEDPKDTDLLRPGTTPGRP
jgi:hypothetical protein